MRRLRPRAPMSLLVLTVGGLFVVGTMIGHRVRDGSESSHQDPAASAHRGRASSAWRHLVQAGAREIRSTGAPVWPFAAIKDSSQSMSGSLITHAREVLGNPRHLDLRFADAR